MDAIIDWITENAHRYWLSDGGPLRPVEEGGAHVVIVSISSDSAPDLVLHSAGVAVWPHQLINTAFCHSSH